jgi:hypothetical protein
MCPLPGYKRIFYTIEYTTILKTDLLELNPHELMEGDIPSAWFLKGFSVEEI